MLTAPHPGGSPRAGTLTPDSQRGDQISKRKGHFLAGTRARISWLLAPGSEERTQMSPVHRWDLPSVGAHYHLPYLIGEDTEW